MSPSLRSGPYGSKAAAEDGIASVQKNGEAARLEHKTASDGRFYFNLMAGNHQVVASSQMYKAAASRDEGIAAVKANGPTATLKA